MRIVVACAVSGWFSAAMPSAAQDAALYFRQNCAACHTVGGGRLTGPDLKDVTGRRDRAWLAQFIAAPQRVIDSGDPYAARLLQDARGVVMPALPTLNAPLIDALLNLLDAESKLPRSQFAGALVSTRPFTQADVAAGRAIFTGRQRLAAGGPSCISCHTVRRIGGLGGGQLAPDLTRVFERLQGRQGVTAWLAAPATPTMRSLFGASALTPAEIDPLVAYFESTAREGGQDNRSGLTAFALLGFGLAAVCLVVMDSAWKHRFRSVRRALVERAKRS
jgi:mono/diheme cytochrome c family protein